jgi:hypothetical protein
MKDQDALSTRARAALADQLRMMLLHPNGAAYVANAPNWDAADAVIYPSGPIDRSMSQRCRRRDVHVRHGRIWLPQ